MGDSLSKRNITNDTQMANRCIKKTSQGHGATRGHTITYVAGQLIRGQRGKNKQKQELIEER